MSGIVFLTSGGGLKMAFANLLYERVGEALRLVVVEKRRRRPFSKRVQNAVSKVAPWGIPNELVSFAMYKGNSRYRQAESWLKESSTESGGGYSRPVMHTASFNAPRVVDKIRDIDPYLIVIFGGSIVRAVGLDLADIAINLHTGFCPYYRGVGGHQEAILAGDRERIATTIHYATGRVDTGDIIEVVKGNHDQPPRTFFKELNDLAIERFAQIAVQLWQQGPITGRKQDLTVGRQYFLRELTYAKKVEVARRLIEWDRAYL